MSGTANQWETVNRYKKARKLADVLIAAGATSPEQLDSSSVRLAATELARVIDPSDVTWELVKHLIVEGR